MEANELRIGNLANHSELGEVEVIAVGKHYIHCIFNGETFYETVRAFSPIPITKMRILKLGLIDETGRFYRIGGYDFMFHQSKLYLLHDSGQVIGRGLRFVHDFQNLYFALTGEELTLK